MRESSLRRIFDKTDGHCHFCGDAITFENRGWAEAPDGHWEVDHVIQKDKGGAKSADNCLPACMRCNRLRWHRKGKSIREILAIPVNGNAHSGGKPNGVPERSDAGMVIVE
jgi:5-methylcytosine-specific restriction endonuclease McrA